VSREHQTRQGTGKTTLTSSSWDTLSNGPGKRTLTEALPHHDPAVAGKPKSDDLEADDGDDGPTASVALFGGKPSRAEQPPEPEKVEMSGEKAQLAAAGGGRRRALTIEQATKRYAPLVYMAVNEANRPASASEFISNSRLRWSHDSNQRDHGITGTGGVNEKKLGSGGYSHQTSNLFGHNGDPIKSNADVRPKDGHGSGGNEGFFLDLDNSHRASRKSGTDAPVYFEAKDHHYITYWFFYAFNDGPTQGKADGVDDHEGDWERICVRLNPNNRATEVAYYQHEGPPKKLLWKQVPKSGSHPLVFSAKGSHASYASAGDKGIYKKIAGKRVRIATDHASYGKQWHTRNHLVNAHDQDWYGYGGAWGEVGAATHTTGPQGPSRFKAPAPDDW
jgi:hypothetical protein